MVSAQKKNRFSLLRQPGQEPVKEFHCLCRRYSFIIDISCDQDCVRRFPDGDGQNLRQEMTLILQHGKAVYPLSNMQI